MSLQHPLKIPKLPEKILASQYLQETTPITRTMTIMKRTLLIAKSTVLQAGLTKTLARRLEGPVLSSHSLEPHDDSGNPSLTNSVISLDDELPKDDL